MIRRLIAADRKRRQAGQRGLTLVEMASVTAIVMVLASITIPVANTMVKRQKELELREALREIRTAIDEFQYDATQGPHAAGIRASVLNTVNTDGYPEELKWLVAGVEVGDAAGTVLKYLRRLPRDPITGSDEWGTRSSKDPPDALFSDGMNIFDVYTQSEKVGLNGKPYREW